MVSGGPRTGEPGKAYANRSDLTQGAHAAPGQQYGKAKEQIDAQKVVPLPAGGAGTAAGGVPTSPPAVPPGSLDFTRASERPNEPVTSGLPMGAGPGPEVLGGTAPDIVGAQLRELYRMDPNNDILRLIELHDRGY